MTDDSMTKEIAPKRQRMMDMILVLGNLKEEAAIPLSKVNEEIASLKNEIEPLVSDIVKFPETYFQKVYDSSKKNNLAKLISERGVLSEAISNIEKSLTHENYEGLRGMKKSLSNALESMTSRDDGVESTKIDVKKTVSGLPGIVTQIRDIIQGYEESAHQKQEKAKEDLDTLTASFNEIISNADLDPDARLDSLQKIGTKTRYRSFLQVAAQLKRGKREERIDDNRFETLVDSNLVIELQRGLIMFTLNNMGSKTVIQLSDLTAIPPEGIQRAIVSMISRGDIEMVGLSGDAPVFARVIGKAPDSTLVLKRVIQHLRGVTKTSKDKTREQLKSTLEDLEIAYNRLQMLGEYDETKIAEPMKMLSDIGEKMAEAAIGSQVDADSEELRLLVSAGLEAFARFRLKIALEKGPYLVSGVNVYGEKLDPAIYKEIMDRYLENELERGTMLILIREIGAMTAKDLADRTNIPQDRILQHLLRMKRDELLTIAGETHGYLLYDVPRTLNEAEIALQTIGSLALQVTESKKELEEIISNLTPDTIGRLTNALDSFAKARDKMEKVEIEGTVIAKEMVQGLEDTIKSAVSLAYRTRARIPSTRPKVTIEDLMDVDVPTVLDEYREMMGYAPLLGFGTIEWDQAKCLGCRSCEIACPENAIELKAAIDIPKFFEFSQESIEALPVNRAMFYETVKKLATTKPTAKIEMDGEKPGFGSVEVDLWLCVGCRTCVRRCPGPENGALELDLKWSLPEVIRHITTEN